MALRLIIFLLVLAGIDLYSYQWFRHLIQPFSNTWKLFWTVIFWSGTLMTILLLLSSWITNKDIIPHSVLMYLRAYAFISYFAKLVSVPFVLIDDLRRGTGYVIKRFTSDYNYSPSRSRFISTLGAVIAGIPFTSLIYGMARNAYRYQVRKLKIPIKDLPAALQGLRIVQISDIHSGSFTAKSPVKKSIELINDLKPDLLLFTGDLVNYKAEEIVPYIDIFSQLKGKYGSYSIFGNHDYGDYVQWPSKEEKAANLEVLKKHHADIGWKLLLNQHDVVTIQDQKLSIIGVENFSASRRFSKYGSLSKAYEGVPQDSIQLLMSHDPSHWHYEVTKEYKNIALTMSGHTHGFQFGIEVPGYIKWSPSQYMYKEWAGLYTEGDQHLYVNRGFGFLAYPGRVGILPEITLLELVSA